MISSRMGTFDGSETGTVLGDGSLKNASEWADAPVRHAPSCSGEAAACLPINLALPSSPLIDLAAKPPRISGESEDLVLGQGAAERPSDLHRSRTVLIPDNGSSIRSMSGARNRALRAGVGQARTRLRSAGAGLRSDRKIADDTSQGKSLDYRDGSWAIVEQDLWSAPPIAPLDKGHGMSATALAELVVARFVDHQRLERLTEGLAGLHLGVGRTWLSRWIARAAELLEPVAAVIAERGLRTAFLSAANQSFDASRGQSGRLWIYRTPGSAGNLNAHAGPRLLWIKFTPDRQGSYLERELEGYSGCLQAMAGTGYDRYAARRGHQLIGCWRQAATLVRDRCWFFPHPDLVALLADFRSIEQVDACLATLSGEMRRLARHQEIKPIARRIEQKLRRLAAAADAPPLVQLTARELLRQWAGLMACLDLPAIELENEAVRLARALAEPQMRWLFGRTVQSHASAATILSVLETCALNGIEPRAYVEKILNQRDQLNEPNIADALLPWP